MHALYGFAPATATPQSIVVPSARSADQFQDDGDDDDDEEEEQLFQWAQNLSAAE